MAIAQSKGNPMSQSVRHIFTFTGEDSLDAFTKPSTLETFIIELTDGYRVKLTNPETVTYEWDRELFSDEEWDDLTIDSPELRDAETIAANRADPDDPRIQAIVE